jgi:serine/threonine protein kinase
VIRYYNSFHDEKSLYIVMEYCENGDLYRVRPAVFPIFLESERAKIQAQVLSGESGLEVELGALQGGAVSALEEYYT